MYPLGTKLANSYVKSPTHVTTQDSTNALSSTVYIHNDRGEREIPDLRNAHTLLSGRVRARKTVQCILDTYATRNRMQPVNTVCMVNMMKPHAAIRTTDSPLYLTTENGVSWKIASGSRVAATARPGAQAGGQQTRKEKGRRRGDLQKLAAVTLVQRYRSHSFLPQSTHDRHTSRLSDIKPCNQRQLPAATICQRWVRTAMAVVRLVHKHMRRDNARQ